MNYFLGSGIEGVNAILLKIAMNGGWMEGLKGERDRKPLSLPPWKSKM